MQHFYFDENLAVGQRILLTQDLKHQCLTVLRYKNHQKLMLIGNNNTKALAKLNCDNEDCAFLIQEIIHNPMPPINIRLIVALIKKDRFEWILQKATELGVSEIIPLITERTQMLEHAKFDTKMLRYQKIIQEACEQSEQFHCAQMNLPIKLKDIARYKSQANYLAFEKERSVSFKSVFKNEGTYTLVVGPEGGFTEEEFKFLTLNDFVSVSLGNPIYRTETAALVFLSQLSSLMSL